MAPAPGGRLARQEIRLSACRRIRVVRWSMRNRSSSRAAPWPALHRVQQGELAVQQRLAGRARLRKMSLIPCRSLAWPTAASTAVCCTAANARLTWPISSELAGSSGSSAATSSPRRRPAGRPRRQPHVGQVQRRVAQVAQLADLLGRLRSIPRWTAPRPAGRGRRPMPGPGRWTWHWRWPAGELGGGLGAALDSPAATPPTACCQAAGSTAGGRFAAGSPASRSSRAVSVDMAAGLTLRA